MSQSLMTSNQPSPIIIWSPSSSSVPLYEIYTSTVAASHPPYALPVGKFHSLLIDSKATVFIASSSPPSTSSNPQVLGFALTLLHRSGSASSKSGQHLKGSLALLCVLPAHQTHGIGSSLHQTALSHLTDRVARSLTLSTPPALSSQLQLGSIFPRIFPGVPEGPEFDRAREWFERRGWSFKEGVSIDLYRTLVPGKEPEGLRELMGPAERRGLTFGPPGEGDVEGLMELQKAEFDDFTGWPDMFPSLVDSGHRDDIECAYDAEGKIVGATVAALGPVGESLDDMGPMHASLAWPCTLGSRCAIIACVGISSTTRGSGAGIALVASALLRLARRGADGCFVDWVTLKGFYEKAGLKKWERGYREAWRCVAMTYPSAGLS